MPTRALRGLAALLVLGALALVAATPGQAGSGKCSSSGQAVIRQQQQVIYFVASASEYRGCYAKSGRVTRLVTRGYAARGVVAHGTHATILEFPEDPPPGTEIGDVWQLSLWNIRKGKKFRDHTITVDPDEAIDMIDDVLGDPVTAVEYFHPEDGRVLDVVYDKGTKRLSKGTVKRRSAKVSGRKITWVEDGKRRSKRV